MNWFEVAYIKNLEVHPQGTGILSLLVSPKTGKVWPGHLEMSIEVVLMLDDVVLGRDASKIIDNVIHQTMGFYVEPNERGVLVFGDYEDGAVFFEASAFRKVDARPAGRLERAVEECYEIAAGEAWWSYA